MYELKELIKYCKDLKLLYVEDNEPTRKSTKVMLDEFFSDITIAIDGQDGLEKFKDNRFDIIITDINMPKLTGLQMAKEIKEIDYDIPILIFSAHNESSYFQDSISINIDGYLLKPINFKQFSQTLNKVLESIENKKAAKQLENIKKEQEKNDALSIMLKNIAHHWRQPLNMITTAAGTIQMQHEFGIVNEEDTIKSCGNIINKAEVLSKMIEDFNSLFEFKNVYSEQSTSIEQCLKEQFSNTQLDIKTIINIQKDIKIYLVQDFLYSIIHSVLQNSFEALESNNIENKVIYIDIFTLNDDVVIKIKDNANGIDEDKLDKIFEPYFTTYHQYFGKGMGLYFVHHLITKQLFGTIDIKNIDFTHEGYDQKGVQTTIKFKQKR